MKNKNFAILIALLSLGTSAHAWQMINFKSLESVSDNQIIYTFLKNSYFSKSLSERKASPFHYALGKCNLTASSSDDGITFEMKAGESDSSILPLTGSVMDAGNELTFVKYFREQTQKLNCF